MNFKKIAAIGASVVIAAVIVTGVPTSKENISPFAIAAEAADSKLAAPKNLKAAAGDGKVTLTWDKINGADAYRVYIYNANTKKYEKCKFIKGEKTTITGLENGKTYKFKVAAAVKSGKSYKTGTASAAVSAKPKATEKAAKETKPKMTEVNLSINELAGLWVYYDFLSFQKYTTGTSYDPNKLQFEYEPYISSILVSDEKHAQICYNSHEYGKYSETAEIKNNKFSNSFLSSNYKVYSYGDDKFLFFQFINEDGEHTYVFKYDSEYVTSLKKTQITDIADFEGTWTATDYCQFDLKYRDNYNPLYPICSFENLYVTGAIVKDGKIIVQTKDFSWNEIKIGKNKIGDDKYFVYEIDGSMYMYFQWSNGAGDKQFYVLKKN